MTPKKDTTSTPLDNEKDRSMRKMKAGSDRDPRTYRSVLIAASVGVLIGLLLKR